MQQKQEAFMTLYMQHNRELSNYCRALMRDNFEAKDLISETVLIAFEKFETINDTEKFKFFLFGIASRLFRKKIRRKQIVTFTQLQYAEKEAAKDRADDDASLKVLYQCINKLKAAQAEIVVLSEISGFSLLEISEILNMNLSTVKSNLYRAKSALVKMLEDEIKPEKKNIKTQEESEKNLDIKTPHS